MKARGIVISTTFLLGPGWGCVADAHAPLPALEVPEVSRVFTDSVLVQVRDIAVDEDGVWVLNGLAPYVVRFSHSGDLIGTFGRDGDGPSELGHPTAFFGQLRRGPAVLDAGRRAVVGYNVDGSFADRTDVQVSYARVVLALARRTYGEPFRVRRTERGAVLGQFPGGLENLQAYWFSRVVRMASPSADSLTMIVDFRTRFASVRERLGPARELVPIPLWDACDSGEIVAYMPVVDSILRYDWEGHRIGGWVAPARATRFSSDERDDYIRGYVVAMASRQGVPEDQLDQVVTRALSEARNEFSDIAPRYVDVLCSSDGIWLKEFSREPGMVGDGMSWTVLRGGSPIATVDLPAGFKPTLLRDDRIWGILRDSLDVESIASVQIPEFPLRNPAGFDGAQFGPPLH
jgi:hypothetical protein